MVPVLNENGEILFPCKERRARKLMEKGEAIPYYQKGIFCIKLIRKETDQREEYPNIALGIDPGSKREGYTVLCDKGVVLNITSNTPYWVKSHMETRRNLRRSRRYRKTPYRKIRLNRASLKRGGRLPPSTKARWDAKLRIINSLQKILPITNIVVEDIKAITKQGKKLWNTSFSPLEQGKKYFYKELYQRFENVLLISGKETSQWRDIRDFEKNKNNKLSYTWETHNVDSHSLAEMAIGKPIKPFKKMYIVKFIEYFRRQLQVQNPIKGGIRKKFGSTVSLGLSRGSFAIWKKKKSLPILGYIGGTSNGRISIERIVPNPSKKDNRITRFAEKKNIKVLYNTSFITYFKN